MFPVLSADNQRVTKAFRCNQCDPGQVIFDNRVGDQRCAMYEIGNGFPSSPTAASAVRSPALGFEVRLCTFAVRISPPDKSSATTSVNVPPTSMPTFHRGFILHPVRILVPSSDLPDVSYITASCGETFVSLSTERHRIVITRTTPAGKVYTCRPKQSPLSDCLA